MKFQLFMASSGQLLTKIHTLILCSQYIIVSWGWFTLRCSFPVEHIKQQKNAFVHYGFWILKIF